MLKSEYYIAYSVISTPVLTPNLNKVLVTPQFNYLPISLSPSISHTPSIKYVPMSTKVSPANLNAHNSASVNDNNSATLNDSSSSFSTSS